MINTLALRNKLVAAGMDRAAAEAHVVALDHALRQAKEAAQAFPCNASLPKHGVPFDTLQFRNTLLAGGVLEEMANAETEIFLDAIREAWEQLR